MMVRTFREHAGGRQAGQVLLFSAGSESVGGPERNFLPPLRREETASRHRRYGRIKLIVAHEHRGVRQRLGDEPPRSASAKRVQNLSFDRRTRGIRCALEEEVERGDPSVASNQKVRTCAGGRLAWCACNQFQATSHSVQHFRGVGRNVAESWMHGTDNACNSDNLIAPVIDPVGVRQR